MDYLAPFHHPLDANPLFPSHSGLEQWFRLTLGSVVAYTTFAPVLRGITMRMTESEHRRQGHWSPASSKGPFLPYSTTRRAILQVWNEEGVRGFYRGMGILYAMAPIRAAFHLYLLNYLETNALPAPTLAAPSPTETLNRRKMDEALGLKDRTKDSNSNSTSSPTDLKEPAKPLWVYIRNTVGLVMLGELLLYPARFLYARMGGDLLSNRRTIQTNESWRLFKQIVRAEGFIGLYRGFLPSLVAITLPAAVFAFHRYDLVPMTSIARQRDMDAQNNGTKAEESWLSRYIARPTKVENVEMQYSFSWFLACFLVYPFITSSVTMATSTEARLPEPKMQRMMNIPPPLMHLVAKLFPRTSTAYISSFSNTIRRVLHYGPSSAFAAYWTSAATRVGFSMLSSISAAVLIWPSYALYNHQHYQEWSIISPQQRLQLDAEQTQAKDRRDDAYNQLLNESPSATLSAPPIASPTSDINNSRYEDGDQAIASLGLNVTPVLTKRDSTHLSGLPSSASTEGKSSKGLTGTGSPQEQLLMVVPEDLQALKHWRPSASRSPSSTSSSEDNTSPSSPPLASTSSSAASAQSTSSAGEGKLNAPASAPRPRPVLSRKKRWYEDYGELSKTEGEERKS